jgi:hypothetical protein
MKGLRGSELMIISRTLLLFVRRRELKRKIQSIQFLNYDMTYEHTGVLVDDSMPLVPNTRLHD